jgi:hypothetical protein
MPELLQIGPRHADCKKNWHGMAYLVSVNSLAARGVCRGFGGLDHCNPDGRTPSLTLLAPEGDLSAFAAAF